MDELRFRTKSLGVDLYKVQENIILYMYDFKLCCHLEGQN